MVLLLHALQLRVPILIENAIWFIILGVMSILLIAYTLWRKRDVKLLILFFVLGAIAGLLECIVFIWLDSYEYYPGILEHTYYDMVLGAYLSQVIYVSSVALFIAAFQLRWVKIFMFVILFVALEYLFLTLGIFKHNWWRTVYTAVGLVIFFWISKMGYTWLRNPSSRIITGFTLVCVNYMIYANLVTILYYGDQYHFHMGLFHNAAKDTLMALIFTMVTKSILIALICFSKVRWMLWGLLIAILWSSYALLIHLDIFAFKHAWGVYVFAAMDIVVIYCCYYCYHILRMTQGKRP